MVRNQGDTIGLLVCAPKPYVLPHQIQYEVAALSHVPDDGAKNRSCQSIWKPSHGYNDLLYRVSESAIVLSSGVLVKLLLSLERLIFRVPVANQSMYFVCAKPYRILGFSGCSGKLIQEGDQVNVFSVESSISRKVILTKDEDVAGHPSYLVVDYMMHIFPVTRGTVAVPYCPCINDSVYVMGDDEATTWKARVVDYIRRHAITGHFFKRRDSPLWVLEGTRNQELFFDSILGVVRGNWETPFTVLCGGMPNLSLYVVAKLVSCSLQCS